MSVQVAVIFLVFSLSMALTPGAGNLTLMGIANRSGMRAGVPFIAGTLAGVLVIFAGAGLGVVELLERFPFLFTAMKYLGAAYLLYLAWQIAFSRPAAGGDCVSAPGFCAGAAVQLLNPKTWIAAVLAFSQFIDLTLDYMQQAIGITLIFTLTVMLSTVSWACLGAMLKRFLNSPRQMTVLNRGLGTSLALTVVMMLGGQG